jgi:putative transposase
LGLKTGERKELALGLYESEEAAYSKRILAETLGVAEGTLYYEGVQHEKDLKVKEKIEEQYKMDDTMGAGKLAPLLGCSEEKVARVMLKFDIIPRKKAKKYRYAGKSDDVVDNQLLSKEDIENYEVVFSDIFEFRLSGGSKVYGCFMMRKKTRQILSFSYAKHMRAELVAGGLKHVYFGKDLGEADVIFHSDQGSQYGAEVTVKQILEYRFERSMSRAGTPTDNGVAERFVGIFKHSVVERYRYERLEDFAEFATKWLNFYNNLRPHSSLGNKSPNEYARENRLSEVHKIVPILL